MNVEEIELERYELREAPRYRFDLDRRDFLRVLGGGLVVLLLVRDLDAQGRRNRGGDAPTELGAWLHIGEDGSIRVFTGKTEVGQNIRTSLAQAVAEELRVPVSSIAMVMADTDLVPFDRGTYGSLSTPQMSPQLRRAAIAARSALLGLAANRFGVTQTDLTVADGKVSTPDGQTATFAELTKDAGLVAEIDEHEPPIRPERWTIMGTSVGKVDGRDFVTGAHRYTTDLRPDGLRHGKILRPPAIGAELVSADFSRIEALPEVTFVRDGNFLGVVAPTAHAAARALEAIEAEWTQPDQPSNAQLWDILRGDSTPPAAKDGGLATTCTVAYIAHAPLEPRAAVAEWKDGALTVWTGTQRPFGVRGELAEAFGMPEERIRVIVPDTGSGYGGKHSGEAAVEAARLAKEAGGPVKLVWTREEEFTWAYARPAGVIDIASGMDSGGRITAWECHNYNSGRAALESPYAIPGQVNEAHRRDSPLRQGSYRGLASAANVFAREIHMDRLAEKAGIDPLEFRLRNLEEPRLRAVLEAAAERFGWKDFSADEGRGAGIACGVDKGSVVAACAEVSVDPKSGRLRVERLAAAYECGAIVNPAHLHNQVEGGIVMGLGGALFEAVEFADGRILNPRFSSYRVPRFSDMPGKFEIVLLDRKDIPSAGAGETPIVCVAPAIGNAIFGATGRRVDSLPMKWT